MKIMLSTLSAALMLGAGLSQAAPFVNHYDASLAGTVDSDNSIELRDYREPKSLPDDFVASIDVFEAGSPDSDRVLELRGFIAKRSLPPDFVPSIDLWNVGGPDDDGSVVVRADGKACPITAAKQGIC